MKFGFQLTVGPSWWAEIAVAAEAAGFESIWLPDHLIFPVEMTGEPGSPGHGVPPFTHNTPIWDPFIQIAWLAAHTSTLRFGTNVYNVGLRHPFVIARALTTADLVSNGRVEFGIGSSWMSQEWTATQLSFESRGARVDESLEIIRRLFTDETVAFDGEHFAFQEVGFVPKPVNGSIPFHIGGDAPAALRRAAAFGDGWLPPPQPDLETIRERLAVIETKRRETGRTGPFDVSLIASEVDSVDDVRRYESAGATRLLVRPYTRSRDAVDALKRFGDEVIARV